MRIQEVCDRTGLTKRNIHYYIQEELIAPAVNKANGYYIFSENDCKRLIMVNKFRNAGLSIAIIRSILNTPASAGYYLRLHANQLKKEMLNLEQTLEGIEQILKQLPVNPDFNALYNLGTDIRIPQPVSVQNFKSPENYDSNLVNHFLWWYFLPEGNLTEYQKYIWDKLNRSVNPNTNQDYQKINLFLQSLNQEQIDSFFIYRTHTLSAIAELNSDGCNRYVERMKNSLHTFLENDKMIATWKKYYENYIYPNARIYDSEINIMIAEISPLFIDYAHNIHIICDNMYRWLYSEQGSELLHILKQTLNGYLDLEHSHHAELAAIDDFQQMMY